MKKIHKLQELLSTLKPYLKVYLESQGVQFDRKNFCSCIRPDHPDRNPSASLYKKLNNEELYCFGCGQSFDIFSAANIMENKPLYGAEFITENVFHLAKLFEIDTSGIEIDENDLLRMEFHNVTRMVANYVLTAPFSEEALAFLNRRGVDFNRLRELNIGFVDDYGKFEQAITNQQANIKHVMKLANLDNRQVFNPNNIIFVVKDEYGRPVGFAARNLLYNSSDSNSLKFINQGSPSEHDIYKKGSRLFGLSDAEINESKPLYIFEGYLDQVIGKQYGLNCAAIGSTAFTQDHLGVLDRSNHKHIVLCFDGDDAGIGKTYKLIDHLLNQPLSIDIRLCFLPVGQDPDTYIIDNGIEGLTNLPKLTPFEWRLNSFLNSKEEFSPEEICQIMVPYIAIYESHLKRLELCKILSVNTGIDRNDIKIEVDRLLNTKAAVINKEIVAVVDNMVKEVKRAPDQASLLLETAVTKIEQIQSSEANEAIDVNELSRFIADMKLEEDNTTEDDIPGLNFGQFKNLFQVFAGNMLGKLILIPGGPNVGKSSFFTNLSIELASSDLNIVPFFHTIDDSRVDIHHRILSVIGSDLYPQISTPKIQYYKYHSRMEPEVTKARNYAYDVLMELVNNKRLFIKDAAHGTNSNYTFNMARRIQDITGKNVVIFLDNIHNLTDFQNLEGRFKYKAMADFLKHQVKKNDFTMFGTVEYTKGSGRVLKENSGGLINELISETVTLEYRADAVMHLYNELHYNPYTNNFFKVDWAEEKFPIINAKITKNKISPFKGEIFFDFYAPNGRYTPRLNHDRFSSK